MRYWHRYRLYRFYNEKLISELNQFYQFPFNYNDKMIEINVMKSKMNEKKKFITDSVYCQVDLNDLHRVAHRYHHNPIAFCSLSWKLVLSNRKTILKADSLIFVDWTRNSPLMIPFLFLLNYTKYIDQHFIHIHTMYEYKGNYYMLCATNSNDQKIKNLWINYKKRKKCFKRKLLR